MNKTLLIIAALAATTVGCWGRPLSPDAALARISGNYEAKHSVKSPAMSSPRLIVTGKEANQATYYVFATQSQTLIVSADDLAYPLLGYIDNPSVDFDNLPPQMEWWLGEYSRQIAWANAHRDIFTESAVPEKSTDSRVPIAPLCATTWDQDAPYNNLCPMKGGKRTVTGCVATAMAQVMKYFNWPATGTGSVSYRWNRQTLTMDFGSTTFQWDKMLNSYPSSTSGTADQREAVATLMKACGYSVEMDYGVASDGGSGASSWILPNVIVSNFNYDIGARTEFRDFYELSVWEDMIYDNLANVGPVLYGGSGTLGGHEFVCDGYSSDGYFHINWGWSGDSDGYFKLTALNPPSLGTGGGAGGFNTFQDATLGICRPRQNSTYPEPYMAIDGDLTVAVNDRIVKCSATDDGGFFNLGNYSGDFTIGLQMTDNNGSVYYTGTGMATVPALNGWYELTFEVAKEIPGGIYHVVPAYRLEGGDWKPFRTYITSPSTVQISIASSGVEDLTAADDADKNAKWFNLHGAEVDGENLPAGIYLKVAGGKAEKVVVK